MFFDFIEIGTSDFDTEIQQDTTNKVGLSIEPVKYYLDRLPDKDNCKKLHMGVSNYNGTGRVYYIPENIIHTYSFPTWVRGCNSINSYHKTVSDLCKLIEINIEDVSDSYEVPIHTLASIFRDNNVSGVYYLKIDTEGHDVVILKKFHDDMTHNNHLPHKILFESNVLSTEQDVTNIIALYEDKGYDLITRDQDTTLQLNLQKIKHKSMFTNGIQRYYIMDYPSNYDPLRLPHLNTLESAKEFCVAHNCSGITLQNGIYEVRNGKYMKPYDDTTIVSWIYV